MAFFYFFSCCSWLSQIMSDSIISIEYELNTFGTVFSAQQYSVFAFLTSNMNINTPVMHLSTFLRISAKLF